DPHRIAAKLNEHRLALVLHNLPAGKWDEGERGIACHPGRTAEFRADVDIAIRYAKALGAPQLNCLLGVKPAGVSTGLAWSTAVDNLRFAADRLASAGIRLLIEPLNPFDTPGFFLSHSRQALELISQVGSDNLFLQYDVYHMQRMEGEL